MTFVHRRATVDDYDALNTLVGESDALHARLLPGYFKRPQRPARSRSELARLLAALDEVVYVVDDPDGGLAALVHVQIFDTPPTPGLVSRRRAHVDNIVVATRARRQGLGRVLMDAAGAWARAKGAEELLLTVWAGNQGAERFYEKLGFGRVSSVLGKAL